MDETSGSTPISTRLERIATLARQLRDQPLTTLAHHIVRTARAPFFRACRAGRKLLVMRQTQAKWAERVREWRESGQSSKAFTRGKEFKPSTLQWWASRLGGSLSAESRESVPAVPAARVRMVRMLRVAERKAPGSSSLTVQVGAAQVEVAPGFNRSLLRELVEALGGAS